MGYKNKREEMKSLNVLQELGDALQYYKLQCKTLKDENEELKAIIKNHDDINKP